jgi:glucosamine--fructose-6-phosphate aminotransferase (isomerizing)
LRNERITHMCGIVGYIGQNPARPVLVDGLKKLEYRGYDSAGIAVLNNGTVEICKTKGKIHSLEGLLESDWTCPGCIGIGHTRWATHGKPSTENAHPHKSGRVTVVHNGIIENYTVIKSTLTSLGNNFASETDTEVISQLINHHLALGESPFQAIQSSCKELVGSFAAGILVEGEPDRLYALRKESPLIVGLGQNQTLIASDIPAILQHTNKMVFMDDGEIAVLRQDGAEFFDFDGNVVHKVVQEVSLDPVMAGKGGYKHFMLKEIFEQPQAVANTFRGRISSDHEVQFNDLKITEKEIKSLEKIIILACGTSYHAGLVGRTIIEAMTRIPVEVDIGSEFRYRNPIVGPNTLLVSISQSGETADTLAASREAVKRGARMIAVCNVIESSLARAARQGVLYTQAGPEIGVASTKAFTTQITVLYLLAIYLGWKRGSISSDRKKELISDLLEIPRMMEQILAGSEEVIRAAGAFQNYTNFLYLGRGINTPIAYEGALKLKEISYIHAEAYPGGEMKHGPIALISPEMGVVVAISRDNVYEKMLGNMEEVHSRGGVLLVFASGEPDLRLRQLAHTVVTVPSSNEYLNPILLTIPLQLFAYCVADLKGHDVDQPRNLAKSVTVE